VPPAHALGTVGAQKGTSVGIGSVGIGSPVCADAHERAVAEQILINVQHVRGKKPS